MSKVVADITMSLDGYVSPVRGASTNSRTG